LVINTLYSLFVWSLATAQLIGSFPSAKSRHLILRDRA
jgi:hypothetical protein